MLTCIQVTVVLQVLLQNLRGKPKAWNLGTASALISHEREFKALHEVKNMKVSTLNHWMQNDWLSAVDDIANLLPLHAYRLLQDILLYRVA